MRTFSLATSLWWIWHDFFWLRSYLVERMLHAARNRLPGRTLDKHFKLQTSNSKLQTVKSPNWEQEAGYIKKSPTPSATIGRMQQPSLCSDNDTVILAKILVNFENTSISIHIVINSPSLKICRLLI